MLTVDAVKSVAVNPDSLKRFYESAKVNTMHARCIIHSTSV